MLFIFLRRLLDTRDGDGCYLHGGGGGGGTEGKSSAKEPSLHCACLFVPLQYIVVPWPRPSKTPGQARLRVEMPPLEQDNDVGRDAILQLVLLSQSACYACDVMLRHDQWRLQGLTNVIGDVTVPGGARP